MDTFRLHADTNRLKLPRWARFTAIFLIGFLISCNRLPQDQRISLGHVGGFPPGSVTALEVDGCFEDPDPPGSGGRPPAPATRLPPARVCDIPIFIVNLEEEGLVALYNRDPHLGCRLTWVEGDMRFDNPCHGEAYSESGQWLTGPSPRDLDRFGIEVAADGQVLLHLHRFMLGASH